MNRINNSKSNNHKKKRKKKEELEFEEISIKSSKSQKKEEKIVKSRKQIREEKKRAKEEAKQKKKEEKRKKRKRFFIKLTLLLILLIIVFSCWFYKKTEENGGGLRGSLITVLGLSVENVDALESINILLLGISEDISSKLTDTIILCSYNPKTQDAYMLSIPRDTFVGKNKDSAKGSEKINALYSKNPEKLLDKVSEITGLDVEYYAVVKTQALIEIIDIIGGVEFDVPIDMDYDDPTQDLHIHLKKGVQEIDGEKAEQLLRFRHNNDGTSYPASYGDNDFGRMKTQRNFMTETAKQTLSLKNIFKSRKIIDTVFENIETNFVIEDLIEYIPTAVGFDSNNIKSNQLPGVSEKCNDLWFFVYDKNKTKELIKSLNI